MIYVILPSREEYEEFRAQVPDSLCDPRTRLGEPAMEFVDAAGVGSGRAYAAHHFTAEEAVLLQMAGAEVRVGSLDGPIFGEDSTL
jgi:hypothetical protein